MTLIDTINDSGHEQDKDAIAGASGAGFEHAFERHFRIEKREDTKKIDEATKQAEAAEETKVEEKKSNDPSTASVIGKSVVKVVTSASFIRGVFGVLSKMFRK